MEEVKERIELHQPICGTNPDKPVGMASGEGKVRWVQLGESEWRGEYKEFSFTLNHNAGEWRLSPSGNLNPDRQSHWYKAVSAHHAQTMAEYFVEAAPQLSLIREYEWLDVKEEPK